MSRRLLMGGGGSPAVVPTDPGGGGGTGSGGWPATTDPVLLSLRPTGITPLATATATPGDSLGTYETAFSSQVADALLTPYGAEGPMHHAVLFLPPGQYVGGFGTGGWRSIVGMTGNPEDVIIFSDTEEADGVIHPYGPIHVEGVTLKAGFSTTLGKSPKYCAHIAGSARTTFANVIFDAYDARPAGYGNAGTVGSDGNVGSVITFYRCEFIRSSELVGEERSMNLHGGPQGLLPMSVAFIDCTMPNPGGFAGDGTSTGQHDQLYVIGGTVGGAILTNETTDVYTDHPNTVENPATGGTVGTVTRSHTDWPKPDPEDVNGLTPTWHDYFYPANFDAPGTTLIKAPVTDAAPMTPVAGRTYYCPVPVTTALWLNRYGLKVHSGAGKAIDYRPEPDERTYYGSIQPGNMPTPAAMGSGTLGVGDWLTAYYYSWMIFPATPVGGNRLWLHFKLADVTGVSIDGSASLPGLHDCYYSDNDGTTLVKATAGTPFPLAHAAQVR